MWRVREHSYCQLFPVTVVCANRTEHASFSSNMKTDVVLSCLHLSTDVRTELNFKKLHQNALLQTNNSQCKSQQCSVPTDIRTCALYKGDSEGELLNNRTSLQKLEHYSNYSNKSDHKTAEYLRKKQQTNIVEKQNKKAVQTKISWSSKISSAFCLHQNSDRLAANIWQKIHCRVLEVTFLWLKIRSSCHFSLYRFKENATQSAK